MNVKDLSHRKMRNLLFKLEFSVPSHVAYIMEKNGSCPYCGCIKAHDIECKLNQALVLHLEADEAVAEGDVIKAISLVEDAFSLGSEVLKEMGYAGKSGHLSISVEDL